MSQEQLAEAVADAAAMMGGLLVYAHKVHGFSVDPLLSLAARQTESVVRRLLAMDEPVASAADLVRSVQK